jgi:ABC-type Fe3+/spermidine/putrescine transport system ATPase subunit
MKNVEVKVEGNKAVITIDLNKELGRSGSGKTTIIGTTGGNQEIKPGVFLGVNCYRK